MQKFRAKIEKMGSWTMILVPFDAKATFGSGSYTPIRGTLDGKPFDDLTLMPIGGGRHGFPLKAALRKKLGKDKGDEVAVVLEKNPSPPVVTVPAELKEALKASPEAKKMFASSSNAMRKEYCKYVGEAKLQETRNNRAVATVLKLEKLFTEKQLRPVKNQANDKVKGKA